MNAKQPARLVLTALVAALGSACSPQHSPKAEMIAVNDENCKPEGIATIKDMGTREQFQEMCVRGGQFKPSPKREW